MKYDVVALGELLIDFTSNETSSQENPLFEANPGGAPCNVLSMLTQLGKRTAFIGKVGNDLLGEFLENTLLKTGIDSTGLVFDGNTNATLAFVQNTPEGDRNFSFFRNPGADTMLRSNEVNAQIISNSRIFHFGTLSLTNEPSKSATQYAVSLAKQSDVLISFDPNLRLPLWKNEKDAKAQMYWGCKQCDILKISQEELEFLTGENVIDKGIETLKKICPQLIIVFVTKGIEGAECFYKNYHIKHPTFTDLKTIDTTGAGDCFCGCCLSYILEHDLDQIEEREIYDMLRFANAASALVTTKRGALCSMPSKEEVMKLLNTENVI